MRPVSREHAIAAIRQFHAIHGRLPRWREWERATGTTPCAKTIERRWGWRELLAEAIGVQPNQIDASWEGVLDDQAQAMLAALTAARHEFGRWPLASEWEAAGRRPSARTFARHFGGWGEACRVAERSFAHAPQERASCRQAQPGSAEDCEGELEEFPSERIRAPDRESGDALLQPAFLTAAVSGWSWPRTRSRIRRACS